MKKLISMIALALAFIMLFAACGSKPQTTETPSDGKTPAGNTTNNTTSSNNTGNNAPAANDKTETKRTDLNVIMKQNLMSIDPHKFISIDQQCCFLNIYEPLIALADDGTILPRVAESYEVADDNVTYTFHIRKGIKFHNGDEVKASDVVFSFKRAMETAETKVYTADIADVKAVDDYTVEIKTFEPTATFINKQYNIAVISERACKEAGDLFGQDAAHTMAGTGPYYFTSYESNLTEYVLEAFEDYYRGPASIKKVTYKIIGDTNTALMALEAGEVDFVSTSTANVAALQQNPNFQVIMNPSTHYTYVKFNIDKEGPLQNKLVRQAVCYAINNEEILYGAYDNYGDLATCIARVGYVFGATDEINTYDYNPEKAKELLKEAGYPDGVYIGKINFRGDLYFATCAEMIQQELAAVGITCDLNPQEQATSLEAHTGRKYDFMCHGDTKSLDSDNFFDYTFNENSTYYMGDNINPEIIRLGKLAKVTVDRTKRAEIYKEYWQLVHEEAYIYPLFHRHNPYAANKDLNVVLRANDYSFYDWSWK